MKKILIFLFCIMATQLFLGCKKTNIPEGNYTFGWTVTTTDSVIYNSCVYYEPIYFEIVESNKDFIVFASSDTLYKDDDKVIGTIKATGSSCYGHNIFLGQKQLSGTCRKEKGTHIISGEIRTIVYGPKEIDHNIVWDTVDAVGTFEMKSSF